MPRPAWLGLLGIWLAACVLDFGKFEVGAGDLCANGQRDPGESDVDCGGGHCPACALGSLCGGGSDCQSGSCVDGVCCDGSCSGSCEACVSGLTGAANGRCAPVHPGTDPHASCDSDEVCDADRGCTELCGFEPRSAGGSCPAVCTGGCSNDTCTIACGDGCEGQTIACPAGWPCVVACTTSSGCRGATINCPGGYRCDVSCTGQFSCRNVSLRCSETGACHLACGSATSACRDLVMSCGKNDCTASCAGGSLPVVNCASDSGCLCSPCT